MTRRFRHLAALLAVSAALTACGGSTTLTVETRTAPTPIAASNTGGTPVGSSAVTQQPVPSSVPTSQPSAAASTNGAAATGGSIEMRPASIPQGGISVIYLNESASSATLRFNNKQYPMLHDGKRWWAIVGVDAFTSPGVIAASITYTPTGKQNSVTVAASLNVTKREFPVDNIVLDESLASLRDPAVLNAEMTERQAIFSGFTANRLWSGPFLPPSTGTMSGIYGENRRFNGGPISDFHRGTDFSGNTGDPVTASANGKVVFADSLKIRGNTVVIDHGAGVFTSYLHLSVMDVEEGQLVKAGDKIGEVGATGVVTGPHLQWEVVVRGVEVDGRLWLSGQEIVP